MDTILNDIIRNILSATSILISIMALGYSMKTSYNPKIKIEPLFNKDTSAIENFLDIFNKKLEKYNPNNIIIVILSFLPWVILYVLKQAIKGKNKIAYGIEKSTEDTGEVILWLRIINPSKYPITIYNIINKKIILPYTPIATNDTIFDDMDLKIVNIANKNEYIKINKKYDEFLNLPVKIDPFSYIEKYVVLYLPSYIFNTNRKYFQPKYKKINITFFTSTKRFTKKMKIYNGNKKYKNINIDVAFNNSKNTQ